MRSLLFTALLLGSTLYGYTLDELLSKAMDANPSLESISHRIAANHATIEASDQFANPELSYVQNTLDSDQAMSRKSLTIKQKLPYFGKRDSQQKVAQAQEGVLQVDLQKAKVSLVKAIKEQAYHVWELKRRHQTILDYEDLTRQNIDLSQSYTSISADQHMGIMSAGLTLSELRIQKSTLDAKIETAYARLSYLAAFKVQELDIDLTIGSLPDLTRLRAELENNPDIALKSKEVNKQQAMVERAGLESYPDVVLLGGYSYREEFDDYWTFGLGVSLPIYGTEDLKEERARRLALSAKSLREDTTVAVDTAFQSAYVQMRSAHETYHIIHDEALPQIEHMFELINASTSTGGDLFKYIDILVQRLKLEQKSIKAVADFNRAEAKIAALSGALR